MSHSSFVVLLLLACIIMKSFNIYRLNMKISMACNYLFIATHDMSMHTTRH